MLVRYGFRHSCRLASGPVAQWITRLTTDQKIPGSNPGRFDTFQPGMTSNLAPTLDLSEILTSQLWAAFSLTPKCDSSQIAYGVNHQFQPSGRLEPKGAHVTKWIPGPDLPTSLTRRSV